jgi:hypothetical protein
MNTNQLQLGIGCGLTGGLLVLLLMIGCSSASLVTRPVHTEATWFVRLDTYQEPENSLALQYDHPAELNESELSAILSRLLVQPEMGLLDRKRPPVAVFSTEDITRMTPILRAAFQQARASEWVSFMFAYPSGTDLEVSSGALFITHARLHVVIANVRERVNQFATDIGLVRKNPMRSISGTHGRLTFDPSRFVEETTSNWSGGSNNSASELVLDYREIRTLTTPPFPPRVTASGSQGSSQSFHEGPATGPTNLNSGAVLESDLIRENHELTMQVHKLEAEVETLNRRLKEQESILLQLRNDIEAVRSTATRNDTRPAP